MYAPGAERRSLACEGVHGGLWIDHSGWVDGQRGLDCQQEQVGTVTLRRRSESKADQLQPCYFGLSFSLIIQA